ncbi:hypothetical protein [Candidatus Palauibacter sp.]|uniref:hypothetical protein n=1 Tax=Candidatus Palauibacter sp. TaxID=3101350 RepID=UPI003AF26218
MQIPLAMLVALHELDMPDDPEDLAVSHLSLNLRQRLGLSSVVLNQIRRYEANRGDVSADEVASIFTLLARRPDAAVIFDAAGHRIGRDSLDDRGLGRQIATRLLPLGLRRRQAWGLAGKIARRLCPDSPVRVEHGNAALVIEGGLPAHTTPGGSGCALLAGLIHEILDEYRAAGNDIIHFRCEARGDDDCTWEFADAGDEAPPTTRPAGTSGGSVVRG